MNKAPFLRSFSVLLIVAILGASCNLPQSKEEDAPKIDVTQAYQTVAAKLTQDAGSKPAATATLKPTVTSAPPATPTTAPATNTPKPLPQPTAAPTAGCNAAAPGNPVDVTIPDDTTILPGQTFTKVWRLLNTGTCTWTQAYSIALFSGDAMGAPASVPMPKVVLPGQTVDISVDLVAPQKAGSYQGNWKLRNESNVWFGISPSGDAPFWVRIIVGQTSITPSVTGTVPTATTGPTPTSTTGALAGGKRNFSPGDTLNLDNNQMNAGPGSDISWETVDGDNRALFPINGALMAVFGSSQPSLSECEFAAVDQTPLYLDDMSAGMYLCYITDLGQPGWIQLTNYNVKTMVLTLQFLTWSVP